MTVSKFVRSFMYPDLSADYYLDNEEVDFIDMMDCWDEIEYVVFDDYDEDGFCVRNDIYIFTKGE